MAFDPRAQVQGRTVDRAYPADIDAGLRAYMLRVYNYMAMGLTVTGIVAYFVAHTPALLELFYTQTAQGIQPTMLAWIAMLSPLAFVLVLSFGIHRMQASTAQLLFWVFAGVMGLSITHIFLAFTGASITRVFFITAGVFAGMSLYGYTTKRDLSGLGSLLFMALFGIILASIVNIFLASSALQFAVSVIGVLVFVGLTAYDTQSIKSMYAESDGYEVTQKKAIFGALRLYLDFINLFMLLLRFFGNRE
jgi:FtsH-binding integral membrane protein